MAQGGLKLTQLRQALDAISAFMPEGALTFRR